MKNKRVKTLRSLKTHQRYEMWRGLGLVPKCYMCEGTPIKKYRHWMLQENQFPYDEVAETNHILTPIRHLKEDGLNNKELLELKKIKKEIHQNYDMILENTNKQKSIPGHFHLHILRLKERTMKNENRPRAVFLTQKNKTKVPVRE